MHISRELINLAAAWCGRGRRVGGSEGEGRRGEWHWERKRKSNRSSLISGAGIAVRLVWCSLPPSLLCHGAWGVTDGRLTCNGSHFRRELYNTGGRKHRQHLINHNLSQIRVHYHQEAGGLGGGGTSLSFSLSVSGGKWEQRHLVTSGAGIWCTTATLM